MTDVDLTIVTTGELAALRGRLRQLRQVAGLLHDLGDDDESAVRFREAGDLLAVRLAVEYPCLICDRPIAVERPLDGPETRIEAVLCGTCSSLRRQAAAGIPAADGTVIVVLS